MSKDPKTTNWNPTFDDKPTSEVPRIRFSQKFSTEYLEKKNLILEIGCGTGSYTRLINRTGCFGLDLDMNAIRIAKKYCKDCEFIVASTLNLPFKMEVFDLICIWGVFEEIPAGSEKKIMVEVQRILKSNAVLLLSTYGDHIVSKILDPAYIFRGVRHYNLETFLDLISECGFSVKEYTIRGGLNTLIANFLFYFYKHILKKREAMVKNFFDKKSANEINSNEHGIVYIFVAAYKKK
jgi:ubiquinone/menaquinone biosynthesis C-methylase UbiE